MVFDPCENVGLAKVQGAASRGENRLGEFVRPIPSAERDHVPTEVVESQKL